MTVKTVSSDIDVMNLALARLGEDEIQDEQDGTAARLCQKLYRPLVLSLLSGHPWKFAQKKGSDTTSDVTPVNEWKYGYNLNAISDFVRLVALYNTDSNGARPVKGFERFGKYIYTNYDKIYFDYVYDIGEEDWPPWFVELVSTALAAKLAIPITDQVSKRDDLVLEAYGSPAENMRGGLYGKATHTDSIENPTKELDQDGGEIIAARHG